MADEREGCVLVVDDDALTLKVMGEILHGTGCWPLLARSAEEASMYFEKGPFMAFIDMFLEGAPGTSLCREVRTDDLLWSIPLVMMTAQDSNETLRRCFAAGADDFIPKPLEANQVLGKLDAVRMGLGVVPPIPLGGKRVFLATDRPYLASLGRLLISSGHQVVFAGDEAVAMQSVSLPFDAAVVDLDLGGAGSGKVVTALRQTPGKEKIPVFGAVKRLAAFNHAWRLLGTFDPDDEVDKLIVALRTALVDFRPRGNERVAARAPFHGSVEFRLPGEREWLASFGHDLSETGMYICTLTPLQPSQPVEVAFRRSDGGERLTGFGQVARINPPGIRDLQHFPMGMGVKFLTLLGGASEAVRDYVKQKVG